MLDLVELALSLKLAVEELVGGKVFHMYNIIHDMRRVDDWLGVYKKVGRGEEVDFGELFEGGIVDWPATGYWKEIISYYTSSDKSKKKNVKIILSKRGDEDQWYRSFSSTILPNMRGDHNWLLALGKVGGWEESKVQSDGP